VNDSARPKRTTVERLLQADETLPSHSARPIAPAWHGRQPTVTTRITGAADRRAALQRPTRSRKAASDFAAQATGITTVGDVPCDKPPCDRGTGCEPIRAHLARRCVPSRRHQLTYLLPDVTPTIASLKAFGEFGGRCQPHCDPEFRPTEQAKRLEVRVIRRGCAVPPGGGAPDELRRELANRESSIEVVTLEFGDTWTQSVDPSDG
jgi:hypothetical protein